MHPMTSDEIARIRAEALEEAAQICDVIADRMDVRALEATDDEEIFSHREAEEALIDAAKCIRALIPKEQS